MPNKLKAEYAELAVKISIFGLGACAFAGLHLLGFICLVMFLVSIFCLAEWEESL